jgi:hypothetical protein
MMMNACMMQSVGFWVSPTLLQSMVCIDGLGGCDLMSLTILPNWESLFDVSKITKIGMWRFALYHLGQDFEILKMNH